MKKEYLLELGIAEDVAAKIMAEHGKSTTNLRAKLEQAEGERDQLQEARNQDAEVLKELQTTAGENEQLKAKLGEIETRNNELKAAADKAAKDAVINAALSKAEARDAEDLLRFIDLDAVTLKDGQALGLTEQVNALKESKPYLFNGNQQATPPPPANGGNVNTEITLDHVLAGKGSMTEFLKNQAKGAN